MTATLSVQSQTTTYLRNYGGWKMSENKFCNVDSLNYPSAWHKGFIDCNTYVYYANNKGVVTIGNSCGNPNPGSQWNFDWSFKNKETQITFGYEANLFDIDSLDSTKLQWSQIKPDLLDTAIKYKIVQVFQHN